MNSFYTVSKFDVRKLRKGIREQATAIEFKRLGNLRNDLEEREKNPSVSEDEKKDIKSRIKSVEQEIYVVHSLPDDKLCDIPPETFDWHQISVQIVRFKKLVSVPSSLYNHSCFFIIVWQNAHS